MRMKRLIIIFAALVMLSGCNVKRHIIMPDKTIYTVDARKDDLVSFKKGDIEITVDGKPAPGLFEKVLMMLFYNLPDVEIVK